MTLTAVQLGQQLLSGYRNIAPRSICLTFDDGYQDFLWVASELEKRGLCATLFIPTAHIGKAGPGSFSGRSTLTWSEVAAISAQGIEIGAHGHLHLELDVLPAGDARRDLEDCSRRIEDNLGERPVSLAYPYGYSSTKLRSIAGELGFKFGFGAAQAASSEASHHLAIPRVFVLRDTSLQSFSDLVDGRGLTVDNGRQTLKSTGWRLVRRLKPTKNGSSR